MAGLIPWRGRNEVQRFRREIDRLFDDFFTGSPFRSFEKGDWMPAVDMSEDEKKIVVHAEIPGMDAKDIDISLNGKVLTMNGERQQEQEEKEKNYHRIERKYGLFSRSVELPADVDGNKAKATYKEGVITLNFHETEEQSVKRIEVKTS